MADYTVKRDVEIKAPISKVFELLSNPAKIPLVMPGLIENKNIPKLPLKKGDKFKYTYQMYGIMLGGIWTVTEIKSPNVYRASTTGDISSKWDYKLSTKNGKTVLKFDIKYQLPKSVLSHAKSAVLKSMNEKEADHFVHNLKTVLEL